MRPPSRAGDGQTDRTPCPSWGCATLCPDPQVPKDAGGKLRHSLGAGIGAGHRARLAPGGVLAVTPGMVTLVTLVPGAALSCDSAAPGTTAGTGLGGTSLSPPSREAGRDAVAMTSSVPRARWPLIRPQSPPWQVRHSTEGFPDPP